MPTPAEVSLPSDTEIKVVREFDAPRSLVYLAFTKPALVQRWLLGPPGWTMPVCEMDLRPGGAYRYRWRSDDGTREFGFHGQYSAVVPERQIDMSQLPEDLGDAGEMEIVTRFLDAGGRTRVEYLMRTDSKEVRDAVIATGMTDGMEMSFKMLDDVLEKTAA
jgi:uncharacterized protein YndB with AHSA1/START domain